MNPLSRPWDRPSRTYLHSPSTQTQYVGNSTYNPSFQVNSSAIPVSVNEVPGLSRQSQVVMTPPAPPPRSNVPRQARRVLANQGMYDPLAYGAYAGYGGYGNYNRYGGYSGYGGIGYGGMAGYGGYGVYNGYGNYGYNGSVQGNPNDPERQFIQLAEDGARPAFQSIISLVEAFHSVSLMLDSTLHAVHTLFHAVLGMADNFGRLRSLFKQFFGSVALFRLFLWSYRKMLYLLGLARNNPNREKIWQNAAAELETEINRELGPSSARSRPAWPILLFLGIVFSGPYLILKFINSVSTSARRNDEESVIPWNPVTQPGHLRVALYDYSATSDDELSFRAGQRIILAPRNFQPQGGWLYACLGNSRQIGLVPSNYLAKPRVPGQLKTVANPSARAPSSVPPTSAQDDVAAPASMSTEELEASIPELSSFSLPPSAQPVLANPPPPLVPELAPLSPDLATAPDPKSLTATGTGDPAAAPLLPKPADSARPLPDTESPSLTKNSSDANQLHST